MDLSPVSRVPGLWWWWQSRPTPGTFGYPQHKLSDIRSAACCANKGYCHSLSPNTTLQPYAISTLGLACPFATFRSTQWWAWLLPDIKCYEMVATAKCVLTIFQSLSRYLCRELFLFLVNRAVDRLLSSSIKQPETHSLQLGISQILSSLY